MPSFVTIRGYNGEFCANAKELAALIASVSATQNDCVVLCENAEVASEAKTETKIKIAKLAAVSEKSKEAEPKPDVARSRTSPNRTMSLKKKIIHLLTSNGSLTSRELTEECAAKSIDIANTCSRLVKSGKIVRIGRGNYEIAKSASASEFGQTDDEAVIDDGDDVA